MMRDEKGVNGNNTTPLKVPDISDIALNALGDNVDLNKLKHRYAELFDYWLNGPESRKNSTLGRHMCDKIYSASGSSILLAILLDDSTLLEKFLKEMKTTTSDEQKILSTYFSFACLCGAQSSGELLMSKLDIDLTESNTDTNDIITRVASSNNMDWLEDLLIKLDADCIPDCAFEHVDDSAQLYALAEKMGFSQAPPSVNF